MQVTYYDVPSQLARSLERKDDEMGPSKVETIVPSIALRKRAHQHERICGLSANIARRRVRTYQGPKLSTTEADEVVVAFAQKRLFFE